MRLSDWSSTCALPISGLLRRDRLSAERGDAGPRHGHAVPAGAFADDHADRRLENAAAVADQRYGVAGNRRHQCRQRRVRWQGNQGTADDRSEERRVGKEGASTRRSRWSADHAKKTTQKNNKTN